MKKIVCLAVGLALVLPGLAWAEMLSVKVSKCNFREGPSVKNPVAFTAKRHYPVKVVKRKGGWLRVVDFEGDKAWVLGRLLGKIRAVVIKINKANIRQKPTTKSKVLFTAPKGAAFKVIKKEGNWLLVQHADGDRGWVHKSLTWGL
ncbi:MAG: SH3 domain-containing protein [Deltaproteobacteria bacterium]|nr:SH3 domain-containing protein [Deltaproteobacteria bacterium]